MGVSGDLTERLLTDEQIAEFHQNGAILIKALISTEWRELLSEIIEEERQSGYDATAMIDDSAEAATSVSCDDVFFTNPDMMRFLQESPLAKCAAQAFDASYAQIYEDVLIYKAGKESPPTPWHQDEPLWPLSGTQMASIWFSLEATTPETGCLQFIAGSHKGPLYIPELMPEEIQGKLQHDMHYFTGGPIPDIDGNPDAYEARSFSTEPGDAILFHPRCVHGAYGNHSTAPRRSFSIRFIGDDVRWLRKEALFFDWLRAIDLADGAKVEHERFPVVWRAEEAAHV